MEITKCIAAEYALPSGLCTIFLAVSPRLRDIILTRMRHKSRRGKRSRRSKLGRAAQKRVGEKIAVLRREGKSAEAAAGEAYGMERSKRLRSGGRYLRAKKRGKSGRRA